MRHLQKSMKNLYETEKQVSGARAFENQWKTIDFHDFRMPGAFENQENKNNGSSWKANTKTMDFHEIRVPRLSKNNEKQSILMTFGCWGPRKPIKSNGFSRFSGAKAFKYIRCSWLVDARGLPKPIKSNVFSWISGAKAFENQWKTTDFDDLKSNQ